MQGWEGGYSPGSQGPSPAYAFSSRSGSRDVSGRGKRGTGYLHPGPPHLLTAGRSLHLHHQVWGFGWEWGSHPLGDQRAEGLGSSWTLSLKVSTLGDSGICVIEGML